MLYSNDVGISNSKPSQNLPEAIKIWVVHTHTHIYIHDSRIIDIMFALFFFKYFIHVMFDLQTLFSIFGLYTHDSPFLTIR